MLNKRGLSHVEAIVSFVLFMGFLIGAFFFFSPFTSNRTLDTTLDYTFNEIRDNATIPLLVYSVLIEESVSSSSVKFSLTGIPGGYESRVEDNNGNLLPSGLSGNTVTVNKGSENFIVVYLSKDFVSSYSDPSALDLTGLFSISSFEEQNIYSELNLEELKNFYDLDYENLRDNFNLPDRIDFGFNVEFEDNTLIVAERTVPEEFEVVSEEKRIKVIRKNGEIEFADLIWKVW